MHEIKCAADTSWVLIFLARLYRRLGHSQRFYGCNLKSSRPIGCEVRTGPCGSSILPWCGVLLELLVHETGARRTHGHAHLRPSSVQLICGIDLGWYSIGYVGRGESGGVEMALYLGGGCHSRSRYHSLLRLARLPQHDGMA